ncbi:ARAP2 protein, partial [Amia calva]|nr:ARAP2 protein [Amia calva]
MGVFPTGYRKRILSNLKALQEQGLRERTDNYDHAVSKIKRKPIPRPRHVFSKDRKKVSSTQVQHGTDYSKNTSCSHLLPEETQVYEDYLTSTEEHGDLHSHLTQSASSSPGKTDILLSSPTDQTSEHRASSEESSPSSVFEFQGEMVINEIYDGEITTKDETPSRLQSRSFKLRHRPVPQIPDRFGLSLAEGSLGNMHHACISFSDNVLFLFIAPLTRTLTPICPYGETFLHSNSEDVLDTSPNALLRMEIEEKLKQRELRKQNESETKEPLDYEGEIVVPEKANSALQCEFPDYEYSMVEKSIATLKTSKEPRKNVTFLPEVFQHTNSRPSFTETYSLAFDAVGGPARKSLPAQIDMTISPYACYYGSSKKHVKTGWLDKLSPQGNCMFQKRWVKFDGENVSYYNNDKEMYSKGIIPISAISKVGAVGDNKFEVVTSHRTFIFRVEKEGDRHDWINTLHLAMNTQYWISQKFSTHSSDKCGYLDLRGYKGKVFVSVAGTKVRLCKNKQANCTALSSVIQFIPVGIFAFILYMKLSTAWGSEKYPANTPGTKIYCYSFTTDSEREKEEWIEAVQESIAETLSDYEVAEKIWFNESNRSCADCHAPQPEWASINLGVVICKKCAGQHRALGPNISKVRSLKLDTSIWSNELVELFLVVGNKNVNSFWLANLPQGEGLDMDASPEKRYVFLTQKYKERKFRKRITDFMNQEQLNKALCAAVVQQDVLETMSLVFSGADVMCATRDPTYCTPYLLAQKSGQRLQMEFLYHNKLSDFPKLDPVYERRFYHDASSFICGFLYKAVNTTKSVNERKVKEEMVKRWCTLEGGFLSYYENEKTATASGRIDITEVVSLAVHKTESMIETGAVFTFEMYLLSERVFLFGAETLESHREWTQAITKCSIPTAVQDVTRKDFELIGQLYYKEGYDLSHWRVGWFALEKSCLHFYSEAEDEDDEVLQLKRLQELTVTTHIEGDERVDVLLMVENGRTLYVHGFTKLDFVVWHAAIKKAAGTDGNALPDQQLSKNGIPIIVDSCIAFVTQHGLCYEGIYQKKGNPEHVTQLLDSFWKDARNVKLRIGEHQLEDVTDVFKTFLSKTEDAILTKELYPYYHENEKLRVEKYSTFIRTLPRVNRTTLAALMQHLYRIQKCSDINQMNAHNLALEFSSCLFQTEGQTSQEVAVIEDLINNYVELFDVNEAQVKQMEIENRFITKWKDTMFSQAGDLIFEVYLEKKEPETCCLIKVSPSMTADELADNVLNMKNIVPDKNDIWITFEVIENGELERPLHYKEKVLEQVLEWSSLEEPGSAYLVIKNIHATKMDKPLHECTKEYIKGEHLKFKDGSSKLLSGYKFQDRYFILRDEKLFLYKDIKVSNMNYVELHFIAFLLKKEHINSESHCVPN